MHKHEESLKIINVATGQIKSVAKMIEDERYCIDISNQIQATISLLKKAQSDILAAHLNSCVLDSIEKNDATHKIEEINTLIKTILK